MSKHKKDSTFFQQPKTSTQYILEATNKITQASEKFEKLLDQPPQPDLPPDKIEEKFLDELITLSFATQSEKENMQVMAVATNDLNAIVIVFENTGFFNAKKERDVIKWLTDNEIHYTQGDAPNKNCFFIPKEGMNEIEILAKNQVLSTNRLEKQ